MFILNMPFCQNTDNTGQNCFKNEKKMWHQNNILIIGNMICKLEYWQ